MQLQSGDCNYRGVDNTSGRVGLIDICRSNNCRMQKQNQNRGYCRARKRDHLREKDDLVWNFAVCTGLINLTTGFMKSQGLKLCNTKCQVRSDCIILWYLFWNLTHIFNCYWIIIKQFYFKVKKYFNSWNIICTVINIYGWHQPKYTVLIL